MTRSQQNTENALSLSYPFDWTGLEDFAYPQDADGIPQVAMGPRWGLQYNPVTIAQYGLAQLQAYDRHGGKSSLTSVKQVAKWFAWTIREGRNGVWGWFFDYDLDFYGPAAPWISGMAQGQAISFCLRAYPLLQRSADLQFTHKAFEAFLHSVADGGVVSHFPDGTVVFEEFPTQLPSLVLNGHIFALIGIHDYAQFWQSKTAADLFQVATRGLKNNLTLYDTGYWNLYDLHPSRRLASPAYLKVHIQLLAILKNLTAEPFWGEVAARWRGYLASPFCRMRWFLGKTLEKIRLRV